MPNNIVMRKIVVSESFQPLGGDEVYSADISALPSNSGNVYFRTQEGIEVPFIPGEFHYFSHIRLSELEVRGNVGDVVTIIGGTW